jgi:hypothetical protein
MLTLRVAFQMAGYKDQMERLFAECGNPGFRSRFEKVHVEVSFSQIAYYLSTAMWSVFACSVSQMEPRDGIKGDTEEN